MLSTEAEVTTGSAGSRPAPTSTSASPTTPATWWPRPTSCSARAAARDRRGDRRGDGPGHRRQRDLPRGAARGVEAAGYRVLTAPDGEEGLRMAARRRPGAIVVDGVLPGIDGATVIRRVRLDAALRGTPCLLLTASDDPGSRAARPRRRRRRLRPQGRGRRRGPGPAGAAGARRRQPAARPGAGGETASLLGPKKILAVDDSATTWTGWPTSSAATDTTWCRRARARRRSSCWRCRPSTASCSTW